MADYPIIDADGHVNEPEEMWPKYLEPQYHSMAPRSVLDNQGRRRRLVAGELHPYIPAPPERRQERRTDGGFNPLARLADMDSEGMDVAVIYPSTGLHFGSVERLDVLRALCRAYNNWLYDYCSAASDRLIGIASVPQLDIEETMIESRRAVSELGFKGVFLRPNPIGGRTLDDPAFEPLWQLLESLDVPLVLHEGTTQDVPQAGKDRYENFLFRHVISHPHEQQMATSSTLSAKRSPRMRTSAPPAVSSPLRSKESIEHAEQRKTGGPD